MQAGMLGARYERDIVPDLLVGTSVGALNATFIASRSPTPSTVDELARIWRRCDGLIVGIDRVEEVVDRIRATAAQSAPRG